MSEQTIAQLLSEVIALSIPANSLHKLMPMIFVDKSLNLGQALEQYVERSIKKEFVTAWTACRERVFDKQATETQLEYNKITFRLYPAFYIIHLYRSLDKDNMLEVSDVYDLYEKEHNRFLQMESLVFGTRLQD